MPARWCRRLGCLSRSLYVRPLPLLTCLHVRPLRALAIAGMSAAAAAAAPASSSSSSSMGGMGRSSFVIGDVSNNFLKLQSLLFKIKYDRPILADK
jgi:hypothetical protein